MMSGVISKLGGVTSTGLGVTFPASYHLLLPHFRILLFCVFDLPYTVSLHFISSHSDASNANMFKKAVEAKSQQRLSGADRKKLKRTIKDKFPKASDSDLDALLPPKVLSHSFYYTHK